MYLIEDQEEVEEDMDEREFLVLMRTLSALKKLKMTKERT